MIKRFDVTVEVDADSPNGAVTEATDIVWENFIDFEFCDMGDFVLVDQNIRLLYLGDHETLAKYSVYLSYKVKEE